MMKKLFTVRLEQVAQRDCGVSFIWQTEKPFEYGPGQSNLGGPAWEGGLDG